MHPHVNIRVSAPLGRRSLLGLENLKVLAFNLIVFITLMPNSWVLQDAMTALGITATTVPLGAAFASLYIGISYLTRALAPQIPVTSIGNLLPPERMLYLTLLYLIGLVILLHVVFRPISFPLEERTIRSFVRMFSGPLVCLLFLGRWHRVRPWPFVTVLAVTWILLVLELWGTSRSIELSNLVRKVTLGSGKLATHGISAGNFFGIYAEPSHAFASLMLCLGGLLLCWRRSLIRLRTLSFGTFVFAAALVASLSRTGLFSFAFASAICVLLGVRQLASKIGFEQLPSRLRKYTPHIVTGMVAGCVALAFLQAVPTLLQVSYGLGTGASGSSAEETTGRQALLLGTLDTLPSLFVAEGEDFKEGLATLDLLTAGRFTQAWVGYSQPVVKPYGMPIGGANFYLRRLARLHNYQVINHLGEQDFEHGRILSAALFIRYSAKRVAFQWGGINQREVRQEAARIIFSLRSYGALFSFYNGIFGWLGILLLVASLLHPANLRAARSEALLMSVAIMGMLTIVAFSIPTLPGAWPLIAIPAYLAKVHDAGEQEVKELAHRGDRFFTPGQPSPLRAAGMPRTIA